jgi:hypothetical protein
VTYCVADRVRCRQIAPEELELVARLLEGGFSDRQPRYWQGALVTLSKHNHPKLFPKFGYVLENNGDLVGVLLTIFTEMPGGSLRCNLSSWYVDPRFRPFGSFLSSSPLKYQAVYLNTSPAPETVAIIEAQGFRQLTSGVFLGVGVPGGAPRSEVYTFPDCPLNHVPAAERQILTDHSSYGCLCLWCEDDEDHCPFVFRRRHIFARKVPCAHLIYCRDLKDLSRHSRAVSRFMLQQGMLFLTMNCNGPVRGFAGRFFRDFRPTYCHGDGFRLGDIAYSEFAMFGM